jgi:hypothetical protein
LSAIALLYSCGGGPVDPDRSLSLTQAPSVAPTSRSVDWTRFRSPSLRLSFEHPASIAGCAPSEDVASRSVGVGRVVIRARSAEGLQLDQFVDRFIGVPPRIIVERRMPTAVDGLPAVSIEYRNPGTNRFGAATFVSRGAEIVDYGFDAGGDACGDAGVADVVRYARIGTTLQIDR